MDKWKEIFTTLTDRMTDDEVVVSDVLSDVAVELVKYRVEHHLDQKDMAKLLNVSQPMISKYESGTYNFTIKTLYAVIHKIGLNVDFCICGNRQTELENSNSMTSSNVRKTKVHYDYYFTKKNNNSVKVAENAYRIA